MPAPSDLCFTSKQAFAFSSALQTRWPENNIVPGKLHRCAGHWQDKPVVILVHGWNGERCYRYLFPYLAWRLTRRGLNAAMIELPYHGRRRPRASEAPKNFISADWTATIEATRQALSDLRALHAWCRAQGCPGAGWWGFSLGAWLCGLIACQESSIQSLVLTTPICRMDLAVRALPFCAPLRQSLPPATLSLEDLNLMAHRLRIAPENVLIMQARHDLFAPPGTIEELWATWGRPPIWRVAHGHISVLLSLPLMERAVRWLAHKAA